jgi:cytochrome c556
MLQKKYLLGGVAVFAALLFSTQVFAQADKRQALMKNNSENTKAIKAAVEAKDYASIEARARDIMGNADKIVGFFPKGSDTGKTKAKAEIWQKFDEFSKNPTKLKTAASELAAAAKVKDDAAITAKVKAVSEVCGNCHKAFRAEKYAE